MANDNGDDRRFSFKNAFNLAVTLIGGMATVLWFIYADQVKEARADIKILYQTKAEKERLLIMEKRQEEILRELEDQRDTLNSHVIASGVGKVIRHRR